MSSNIVDAMVDSEMCVSVCVKSVFQFFHQFWFFQLKNEFTVGGKRRQCVIVVGVFACVSIAATIRRKQRRDHTAQHRITTNRAAVWSQRRDHADNRVGIAEQQQWQCCNECVVGLCGCASAGVCGVALASTVGDE